MCAFGKAAGVFLPVCSNSVSPVAPDRAVTGGNQQLSLTDPHVLCLTEAEGGGQRGLSNLQEPLWPSEASSCLHAVKQYVTRLAVVNSQQIRAPVVLPEDSQEFYLPLAHLGDRWRRRERRWGQEKMRIPRDLNVWTLWGKRGVGVSSVLPGVQDDDFWFCGVQSGMNVHHRVCVILPVETTGISSSSIIRQHIYCYQSN